LAVGVGLYAAASIKFHQASENCPCPEGRFSTWQTVTTTSYVLMAAGGAGAAAGITWWWASRSNAPSYALTAGPSGVYVTGSF
jgi:hypothetical protein